MLKKQTFIFIALLLVATILFSACRRTQEQPTPTPTNRPPTVESSDFDSDDESAEPSPTATSSQEDEDQPIEGSTPAVAAQPNWPPQVIYTSPEPNQETVLDGAITVRFDQPMIQESVEEAFSVMAEDSETRVNGNFEWPRSDTVIFTPQTELRRAASYRLRIDESAAAQSGETLTDRVEQEIQTVGFLEVGQVIPAEGSEGVDTDAAITVLFNRPVVPLVSTGQQAGLPQPLQFTPAVSGEGEWVSTSIYRFVPDQPLDGATRYQVTVESGLEDVTGGVLADSFTWQFTTLQPSVVSVEPPNRSEAIDPTQPLTITFNMPMDPASTEAAISLEPAAPLSFNWSDDGRVVTIQPEQRLELETLYRVNVATSAQSANGAATLDRATSGSFSTVPFPAVLRTYPPEGSVAESFQRDILIEFASPMDVSTIEGRVQIQPEPEEVEYFFGDQQASSWISIVFDLERETDYVVTIPGDVADPYGNTLGEDYTWRFETAGEPPLASLNLPQTMSQLSVRTPMEVTLIHREVSSIEANLYALDEPMQLLREPWRINDETFSPSGDLIWDQTILFEAPASQAVTETLTLGGDAGLETGVYYLEVSAPEIGRDDRWWQIQRNLLVVGGTNLVVKEMFGAAHIWATDLITGEPVSGLDLTLYDREFGTELGTGITGSDGLATIPYDERNVDYLTGVLAIAEEPGQPDFGVGSSLWNDTAQPWYFDVDYRTDREPPLFGYIYTDRPIYRPGDTVYFRGIVRQNHFGRYSLPEPETLQLRVDELFFSPEGDEPFSSQIEVTLDENGNFSGEYTIAEDARLANYSLYFAEQDIQGGRQFTVAEYRRPEFLVSVTSEQTEVLRGEPVNATVEASYFFGGPATDLSVRWTVYHEPYFPDFPGPYSYSDSDDFYAFDPFGPFDGPTYVMEGEGRTDGNGRLVIELPANILEDAPEGTRQVRVEATVLDLTEFGVSSRTNIVYHPAELYVGVAPSDYLGVAGSEAEADLLTVNWQGQPAPNQTVEVVFYQREWEAIRDDSFGQVFTRWEANDTEVERLEVTTNADGEAQVSFTPPEGGTYKIEATVHDGAGRAQTSSTFLWVTDMDFIGWRTSPREKRMDLAADQESYSPGDTARILVQSPFAGPINAWLTIERGDVLEQRIITLQSNSDVLEIPITESFAPNVYVTVVAIQGAGEDSPFADIRLGIVELPVSTDHLALNVSLTPQTDILAPGDTVTYDIQVRDSQGRPVQASLSLALVDLAVLTLKPDNAEPILEAFYHPQPYRSQTGAGLFISGEGREVEIPQEQGGFGGGGGNGEVAADAVALRQDEEEETVRRDFPDTAFWQAVITTDVNGRATVEIPLPDTTTTWRLSSKAATADTLVGQASVDVVATLPLLIRPVTPRFFTVGDVVQLGAVVNNTTDESMEVAVSLEVEGLALTGEAEQIVTVSANGSQRVRWEVSVQDVEFADLTFRAVSGEFRDATKPSFGVGPDQLVPVYRYDAEDIVGTSGVLDEAGRRVEAVLLPPAVDTREGEVEVKLSPSLAAAVLETLTYLDDEYVVDPVCAHSTAHRLLPNVAAARALAELGVANPELEERLDALVPQDIERIEALQKSSGGWTYCLGEEIDPYLSAYILFGLVKAQEAGYEVSNGVINSGLRYLHRNVVSPATLNDAYEVNRQAFYLYVLAEAGDDVAADADALVEEHRHLLDPYAAAFLALAYEMDGAAGSNQQALLNDLSDSAIVSATGAHWEDAENDWRNLNSDVRGTAVVVSALAQIQPDHALAPGAVRWLMSARTASHWSSIYETVWSVLALTDWMVASGELEADFEYLVNANATTLAEGTFTESNILSGETLSVPVSDLLLEEVNFFDFQRGEGPGRLYYTMHLDSFIAAETVEAVDRGVIVQRAYYDADCDPTETECQPIDSIEAGESVRVELTIIAPNDLFYVNIEDPLPAGAEAVDPGLATSATDAGAGMERVDEEYRYGYWGWWFFNQIQFQDDRVVFTTDFLPAGTYQYTYTLNSVIPGDYQVRPTIAYQEFFPEVFGRSEGMLFTIGE